MRAPNPNKLRKPSSERQAPKRSQVAVDLEYIPCEKIADGDVAAVMLGVSVSRTGFRHLCVIKQLHKDLAAKTELIAMLQREAAICQSLQHPNIVQTHAFERLSTGPALIMEYIHGTSLSSILGLAKKAQIAVPVPMAGYIGAELAKALAYIHGRKDEQNGLLLHLVHQSVAPANVLIGFEGEVKLSNFGYGRLEPRDPGGASTLLRTGRYSYLSPEQVSGNPVGPPSDLFSLGLVLWELLVGERFYLGERSADTAATDAPLHAKLLARLPDLNRQIDPALQTIVESCLQLNPEDRCHSVATFARDLAVYLQANHPNFSQQMLMTFVRTIARTELEERERVVAAALQTPESLAIEPQPAASSRKHSQKSSTPNSPVNDPDRDRRTKKGKRRESDLNYLRGKDMTLVEATSGFKRLVARSVAEKIKSAPKAFARNHERQIQAAIGGLRPKVPTRLSRIRSVVAIAAAVLFLAAIAYLGLTHHLHHTHR